MNIEQCMEKESFLLRATPMARFFLLFPRAFSQKGADNHKPTGFLS